VEQLIGLIEGFHLPGFRMADQAVRIHLPPVFFGQRDPLFIISWVSKVKRFVAFYNMAEANALKFVITLLEGEADLWWGERESQVALGNQPAIATVDAFVVALKLEFKPEDYDFELCQQLLKLYQNKSTVREYTQEFCKISILLKETHVKDVIHLYVMHLNKDISWEVMRNFPTSLAQAVQFATRAEDMMRRMGFGPRDGRKDKGKKREDNKPTPWTTDFPGFGYGNGSTPMELDNVQVRKGKGNGKEKGQPMSEEKKKLKAQGLCFKCHQPGHTAKYCLGKRQQVGGNPMAAYAAWAQQYGQAYPTMPNMPNMPYMQNFNHKVNPRAVGIHNTDVVDENTQTTQGCCSHSCQGKDRNH
jgi:Ty3 transposon capsid-like protein